MTDCIIVGGGIIGLLTARELREAGADVMVIERGKLGGESSWAGGGIISPLYPWRYDDAVNVLAQRSKQIYPELVPALLEQSGVDAELLNTGLLIVHDEETQQAMRWAEKYGEQLQHLDNTEAIHTASRCVAPGFCSGLWMPAVMQVRNPRLVQAMRGCCEDLGVRYRENASVDDIIIEHGRARGVLVDGKRIEADNIIVASGAWTGQLLDGRATVDVEPVKGQMVMMKTEPGTVDTMVMSYGHYVIPRKDGHVLAGSTLEHSGYDKSVSEAAKGELYQQACELVPALADYPVIRHWAGLRPGTQSGIPYICEHDDIAGLYIHAGHYRNGIVLGAASAQLLAEMITGKQTFCDPAPYALDAQH